MKVPYAKLRMHFPDKFNVPPEELYQWIGYPEHVNNPNFENTCAIRMSLCLLGAGFPNPGTYPIRAGNYKGRALETRQRALSHWLLRHLGQPEKFLGDKAYNGIGKRHGVVSFFSIYGDERPQGHIAIIAPDRHNLYLRCGMERDDDSSGCFWTSRETWFWPLP